MEYHEQALEFISYHYFKVKDKNHGIYDNITHVMFSITQFPFFGMPAISYLTAIYIYPRIFCYVEQYSLYLQDHDNLPLSTVTGIIFYCFGFESMLFNSFLTGLHITSIFEFISYGSEVLHDEDHYLPYLYAGFSSFAVAALFVCSFVICIYKARRVRNPTPPMSPTYFSGLIIGTSFSVSIVYILCCFAPLMILAFINNPSLTFSIYSSILFIFTTFLYAFLKYIYYAYGVSSQTQQGLNEPSVIGRRYLLGYALFITFLFMAMFLTLAYVFALTIIFVLNILLLGGFNSNQSLQAILLSLLLGFISFAILKPASKKVYTHVGLVNNNVNNEETQNNDAA